MDAFAYKETVTVVDVLDAGACIDGVKAFILKNGRVISCNPSDYAGEPYITAAAQGDGNGDGYGYGDGSGLGGGNGDGFGDGNGDGNGNGNGYGDGDGF